MAQQIFKGFKQVTLEQFNGYTDEQKLGYLWLVRSNISGSTYEGDIYFGTRHYAHQGPEVKKLETKVDKVFKDSGIVNASGETVNVVNLMETNYLKKNDAANTYATKVQLFNTDETIGAFGNLTISDEDK